jgi:hypothetical protein
MNEKDPAPYEAPHAEEIQTDLPLATSAGLPTEVT